MAVDPAASAFFNRQREADPANSVCCDCEGRKAEWASVSHGTYISIEASSIHRSLGVKTSFVLSTTLDSWKDVHLRMMELGGNRRFREFMQKHVPKDMPLRKKYLTRAAEWYRANLKAEAEGLTPPAPLEPGTGHWLIEGQSTQEQLLDHIFAAAPGCNTMTAGGISKSTLGTSGEGPHRRRLFKLLASSDQALPNIVQYCASCTSCLSTNLQILCM